MVAVLVDGGGGDGGNVSGGRETALELLGSLKSKTLKVTAWAHNDSTYFPVTTMWNIFHSNI